MIGVFHTATYHFLLNDTQTRPDLHDRRQFVEQDLDVRLRATATLPDIGSAPVASWLIARISALTDGNLGVHGSEIQSVDGGNCCLEILIFESTKPVGWLQIQAGTRITLFGSCASSEEPEIIVKEFVDALMAKPDEVRQASIRVRNPENGSRRVYGYDGFKYLGLAKPKAPPMTERECVEKYKQQFRSSPTEVIRNMLTYRLEKEAEIAYREILQERGDE